MLFKVFKRQIDRPPKKITLKTILTVPFLLQIFTTVGLVGYLSWRNGNQAVNYVASQLRSAVANRVKEHLEDYLAQPHLIVELNQKAAKLEQIGFNDFTFAEKYFWEEIQIFDSVKSIYMGNPQGKFVYLKRQKEQFLTNSVRQVPERKEYVLDSQGTPTKLIKVDRYDPRVRPWYQKTLETKNNNWSEVYTFTGGELGITAAGALYNSVGKFIGVTGVDFILTFINEFLANINISPNGQAFIVERNGFLVASSSQENPFIRDKHSSKEQRIKASVSQNLLTKTTAKYLLDYFGKLDKITTSQQLEYFINGKRQFVQVLPYQDDLGLDWVIVVVIPESDFMGQINANTRNTVALCLSALGLATMIGIVTARRIAKPVDLLSQASKEIAKGNLNQKVNVKHIQELKLLGESFNSMAEQLQISFNDLEAKERRFRTLLGNLPGAIYRCQLDRHWTMEFISDAIAKISGYPAHEFIDNKIRTYASIIHPEDNQLVVDTIEQAVSKKEPYILEYRIIHPNNSIRWVYEKGIGVFDEQDNFLYLDGAIFDVSDRKQAQEDLRIAEENYRSIFENALEGIFQSTPDGRYVSVNPAMAKIYGYQSPEELISSIKNIKQQTYVNPQDRIEIENILAEKGKVRDFEYQAYNKDGSKIWLEEDSRVVYDSQGKVLYYEGIVQDISERKRVEQQLKQQLKDLKIEIDQNKREKEVAKITQSDYFQELQAEAESLRFNDDDWE